jgi:RND family efflux transporter MFP subunit
MRAGTLALIAGGLAAAGCGHEVRTEQAPAAVVERAASAAAPARSASMTTILYSERDADVAARADGVVRAVFVELGDVVQAGQLLARLEDDEAAAAVEAAAAAAELARAEHARTAELRARQVVHQAELERAAFALRAAEAALRQAQVRLEYTRVRAPFAGSITRRVARVGQNVEAGEPLFRTTALRPLRAQLRVPELEARGLATGSTVVLTALGGERLEGAIARIAAAVDPLSGTVDVLVDVPDPAGLRPGSTVGVSLPATVVRPAVMREN